MVKRMIHVTKTHFDEGLRVNCYKCPIALAVSEHLDLSQCQPKVQNPSILIMNRKGEMLFGQNNSLAMQNKIDDIDCQINIKPFFFELLVPEEFEHLLIPES